LNSCATAAQNQRSTEHKNAEGSGLRHCDFGEERAIAHGEVGAVVDIHIRVQAEDVPFKAGEEVRTLDIQLGKLTLYQLSYARRLRFNSNPRPLAVNFRADGQSIMQCRVACGLVY
jgi:hypothetical protein